MQLILKNRGNYKDLLTFKKATVIYDLTYLFAHRYLTPGDRTVDQMVQAARSGKQNIAEGVAASSTNAETEIKLVNVAKASLKELLTDYEDYLRVHRLDHWSLGSPRLEWVREKAKVQLDSAFWIAIAEKRNAEIVANIAIVLLKQEDYLLFKQLEALERQFKESGDLRGRLRGAGEEIQRKQFEREMREAKTWGYPRCEKCGKAMESSDSRIGADGRIKWECKACKTEKRLSFEEDWDLRREWKRHDWELRRKWKKFLGW